MGTPSEGLGGHGFAPSVGSVRVLSKAGPEELPCGPEEIPLFVTLVQSSDIGTELQMQTAGFCCLPCK